jgi:peptidoglycan/LPS O-acetylase OafA/YrhL
VSSLDGLRGAAAVAVVGFHVLPLVALSDRLESLWLASPLGVLVNGPGAVHLFFVLSGYVLAMTLTRDRSAGGVARYYVRRVFRIHPPYVAAVLFAWVASIGYSSMLGSRGFRPDDTCFHIPARLLPLSLLFPSMAFGQLPVGWSLYVELMMSAVFPLLLLLGLWLHPLAPIVLAVLLLRPADPRVGFLRFAFDFALGLTLFLERERAARWLARLPRGAAVGTALVGVLLLEGPYLLAQRNGGIVEEGHSPSTVVLMGLGSAVLVAAVVHFPSLRNLFSTPLARYLGRISYSLYLLHLTVLLAIVCRVTGRSLSWPAGLLLFAVALGLSIALAELAWRWVEAPSIRAGRALIRAGTRALERGRQVIAP